MLAKVLATGAAVLLVAAVAIGTLGPQDWSLGEALAAADNVRFAAAKAWAHANFSAWVWDHPLYGLLGRPAWLLPATFGLVLAGGAMTAASSAKAPNSRRRRS